jgi:hypothetical protein
MNIARTGLVVALVSALLGTALSHVGIAADGVEDRVVYHVDDASNARWAMLLARAHFGQNAQAKVVIVAHGAGVDFLLEDAEDSKGNPYDPAIRELMAQGAEFRICEATLGARNIPADSVLEGVVKVPSGAYEIARLQSREGYAYLKP